MPACGDHLVSCSFGTVGSYSRGKMTGAKKVTTHLYQVPGLMCDTVPLRPHMPSQHGP